MKNKTAIKISIIILIAIVSIVVIYTFSGFSFYKRKNDVYIPEKAIEYSYKYIEERNQNYPNFEFNCVTYISQCLIAGGLKMDEVKTKEISETDILYNSRRWYCHSYDTNPYRPVAYNLSSAFSYYKDFIKYWKKIGSIPTNTVSNTVEGKEILRRNVKIGDVIILYGEKDNAHAALIVEIDENDIYYNSNTNDRFEYPLSEVKEKQYQKITYLNFVK